MNISSRNLTLRLLFAAGFALSVGSSLPGVVMAQETSSLSDYAAPNDPPLFDTPEQAVDALKAALAKNDFDALAVLLGLDASKLKTSEGVMDTFDQMRDGAAKSVVLHDDGDRKILDIGDELWPLPFPLTKGDDGKWAFDTYAGLEEIINRRVGENEIEAIETMRAYVEAQKDYIAVDHDDDGVLEYAQKLISSDGQTDGLYWPSDDVNGVSPAGDLSEEALEKAKQGGGYFGYRFRILGGQGDGVAGGAHDYSVNGNMITGFGLIAWPVKYAETGVNTFVVNQQGIVYEADLGPDTEALAAAITTFNPDDTWELSED